MDNEIDPHFLLMVTVAALIAYLISVLLVGKARRKYGVQPPTTSGPDQFNRSFRQQQNTLEQLVLFLPSMWVFAWYHSEEWAAVIGSVWVVSRVAYSFAYISASQKRVIPFVLSLGATIILLIGGIIGAAQSFIS